MADRETVTVTRDLKGLVTWSRWHWERDRSRFGHGLVTMVTVGDSPETQGNPDVAIGVSANAARAHARARSALPRARGQVSRPDEI